MFLLSFAVITCLSFSEKSKDVYLIQIKFLYSLLVPPGKRGVSDFALSICFISQLKNIQRSVLQIERFLYRSLNYRNRD